MLVIRVDEKRFHIQTIEDDDFKRDLLNVTSTRFNGKPQPSV